jgi:hypothetical protein
MHRFQIPSCITTLCWLEWQHIGTQHGVLYLVYVVSVIEQNSLYPKHTYILPKIKGVAHFPSLRSNATEYNCIWIYWMCSSKYTTCTQAIWWYHWTALGPPKCISTCLAHILLSDDTTALLWFCLNAQASGCHT